MPRYAEVIVDVSARRVDKPFHYSIDDMLEESVCLGSRVLVPFGRRQVEGYVVGFVDQPDVEAVKPIIDVIDPEPVFTQDQLQLAEWMSDHYLCLRVEALQCILPPGTKHKTDIRIIPAVEGECKLDRLPLSEQELQLLEAIPKEGALVSSLAEHFGRCLVLRLSASLEAKGLIKRKFESLGPAVSVAKKEVIELVSESALQGIGLTAKQEAVVKTIRQENAHLTLKELMDKASVSSSVIRTLLKKGILKKRSVEVRRDPLAEFPKCSLPESLELTAEQAGAVAAIVRELDREGEKRCILLHGVTGSGKTEVYIRAAAAAVERGKQAIVLVPEIALTPQVIERFAVRFGRRIAVLHSGLSLGERYDEWRRIRDGEALVVIGARSAVFAPTRRLGLIVVDEEHEPSYKQEDSPRYHAREVAQKRAELTGAVLLLGSATPCIETYYSAEQGLIDRYELPARVSGLEMPKVHIVDMRQEHAKGNRSLFSQALREAIGRHLDGGGQIILFLNRRGHSTFILCRECGYVMKCRHCDVALTYHFSHNTLRCHYCDFQTRPPDICPVCGGRQINYFGIGTERVERQLAEDFPGVGVVRLDIDTTRRKNAHQKILERFRSGEARVLVGTQMVAKGLDYPRVSLVGVISADTSLNIPDFRSAERTFQLILQVAGRAGRSGLGGEVIVQTYCPDHYSVVAAAAGDYKAFYNKELEIRKEAGYPPFTRVVSLLFHGTSERAVMRASDRVCGLLRSRLSESAPTVQVFGPCPAPLVKIKDHYRWYVWVKGTDLSAVMQLLRNVALHVVPRLKKIGVMVTITVDPMSMM